MYLFVTLHTSASEQKVICLVVQIDEKRYGKICAMDWKGSMSSRRLLKADEDLMSQA